jgi:predicted DNA-binding WGR domain protein
MTLIHRRDPARRMARFYALAVQGDLLAGWSLVREWGRIGRPGRVKVDPHAWLSLRRPPSRSRSASGGCGYG